MPSKQVVDRQRSADKVIAVEAHADEAAAKLQGVLAPLLQGKEKMPDAALLFRLLARQLDASKAALVAADDAHEAELGDDAAPRAARDAAQAALYDEIVQLREVLTGVYGAAFVGGVFPGSTPKDPAMLARYGKASAGKLAGAKLPKARVDGAKFDAKKTGKKLTDLVAALDGYQKDTAREAREAEATLGAKTAAMAAYDEAFAGVAGSFAGLLRAAGLRDLAERVRPSPRRPGQTAADAPSEGAASGDAQGGSPSDGNAPAKA